ncbi:B3 domain-containing protein IDEF1 [Vitis vinifera]|uniref:B3 domain-containing protein IDEF1 n=1 Tax=Vitis vinifera TaxID=29760 RepID=A0A438K4P2_VITVI|nr:B3 domain-containing protein IDEF1 [Vitis vinifera]
MPTAVRAPPLSYNLSAPLSIEVAKRPEMNVFSASQCPKIGNPSDISSSDSIHTQKMLRLSMDVSSDRHEIVNLGASDKHELPLLWKNNAPSVTLSDIINSSETRPGSSPPANIHEDDEPISAGNMLILVLSGIPFVLVDLLCFLQEIKGKGWLMLVQKELRNTDVGNLGRIVLPKKDAEANLPPLVAKDGLVLQMEDMKYSVNWKFKYRYV